MSSSDWTQVGIQAAAALGTALASIAAWKAANASRDAVSEMKQTRSLQATLADRQENHQAAQERRAKLSAIRGVVVSMRAQAQAREEGKPEYQRLKAQLDALLVPPYREELVESVALAHAKTNETSLAGLALDQLDYLLDDLSRHGKSPGAP